MNSKIIFTLLICSVIGIIIVMLLPERVENFGTEIIKTLPQRKELFTLLTSTNKYSFNKENKQWNDLSGNKNNFVWNTTPPQKNNSLLIKKETATLNKPLTKLNKKQFTLMVKCKTTGDRGKTSSIIELPGNDNVGLSLALDNLYGTVHIEAADVQVKIDDKYSTNEMTWYSIVYSEGEKNSITLYRNTTNVYSEDLEVKYISQIQSK